MTFPICFQPELLCAPVGSERWKAYTEHVWYDVEHKRLIATDGSMIGVFPATVDPDDQSGWITGEALISARQFFSGSLTQEATIFALAKKLCIKRGPHLIRPSSEAIKRPNYELVLNRIPNKKAEVALNASKLDNIESALGKCAILQLAVGEPTDPVRITGGSGSWGLLMPCKPKETP